MLPHIVDCTLAWLQKSCLRMLLTAVAELMHVHFVDCTLAWLQNSCLRMLTAAAELMLALVIDGTLAWLQKSCLRLLLTASWLDCYAPRIVEGSDRKHKFVLIECACCDASLGPQSSHCSTQRSLASFHKLSLASSDLLHTHLALAGCVSVIITTVIVIIVIDTSSACFLCRSAPG